MNLKQLATKIIRKVSAEIEGAVEESRYHEMASRYDVFGYKRIYFVHIRKTGGTSINNMFLSLSGQDSASLYDRLAATPSGRLMSNGLVYVGWNLRHINKGKYFYGFSHTPFYSLNLPEKTFTICCFRDPVKRILSHYNMLMDFRKKNIDHPCMATEGKWLGNSFDEFLQRIPKEYLLNQLYMFSSRFDVDHAVSNVEKLSHYFFCETFVDGINALNRKTGLALAPVHIRRSTSHPQLSNETLTALRSLLFEEYIFLNRIRELSSAEPTSQFMGHG